jgi:Kef-type K+ transport system membrane component KefB
LTGNDPTAFNAADPLRLWIIQVGQLDTPVVSRRRPRVQPRSHALSGIIIITTQILSLGLRKLRQPRVIAEVIGGILLGTSSALSCSRSQQIRYLGPTAFGRIPGFSKHIFPPQSIPYLSLVANIGLCLFLFLVGLEIDTAIIRRNMRLSVTIAAAGITIPFGLGAALAIPVYHQFIDSSQVSYPHFMLFTGVAYSITAFPVLCRILTELKLLDTTVGIVVLSAGVGNDIIGWTLLALSVALVNAGSGLTALWILLACIGWSIFMLFIVRRVLFWVARNTRSIENGPTILFMTVTILVLFGSAFFTDVIGVHAVFGIVSPTIGVFTFTNAM